MLPGVAQVIGEIVRVLFCVLLGVAQVVGEFVRVLFGLLPTAAQVGRVGMVIRLDQASGLWVAGACRLAGVASRTVSTLAPPSISIVLATLATPVVDSNLITRQYVGPNDHQPDNLIPLCVEISGRKKFFLKESIF